jgi:hypothetical protein
MQDNFELKTFVVEVDIDRMQTKQTLMEIDERSETLLQHNKDQETMHMIGDFKIEQVLSFYMTTYNIII